MGRSAILSVAVALAVAACGGTHAATSSSAVDAAPTSTTAPAATTTTVPASTSTAADAPAGTTVPVSPPVSGVDGPPVPVDAVPFEGGNDILLSQEVLPVYLVFWAEW